MEKVLCNKNDIGVISYLPQVKLPLLGQSHCHLKQEPSNLICLSLAFYDMPSMKQEHIDICIFLKGFNGICETCQDVRETIAYQLNIRSRYYNYETDV